MLLHPAYSTDPSDTEGTHFVLARHVSNTKKVVDVSLTPLSHTHGAMVSVAPVCAQDVR
jgi:hypothetical protein